VISVIADDNRIPDTREFWEAFQPKLYHVTVAALWRALAISSPVSRIRLAQMVSCVAGIVTLWIVLVFLRREAMCRQGMLLVVLADRFEPRSYRYQVPRATNDSFVILFASLALFFGYRFSPGSLAGFFWMTLSCHLGGISKGNGLVVFLAILGCLLWHSLGHRMTHNSRDIRVALYGSIFLIAYLVVVPRVGSYWEQYRRYGSPFALPIPPAPFPNLFARTFVYKPGGYFHCRFVPDLPLVRPPDESPEHDR
jgi:hypothetical protein